MVKLCVGIKKKGVWAYAKHLGGFYFSQDFLGGMEVTDSFYKWISNESLRGEKDQAISVVIEGLWLEKGGYVWTSLEQKRKTRRSYGLV